MRLVKVLIPTLVFLGFISADVYAQRGQETRFERDLNTRDDQPVREFVESKENIDIKEKASNLEISGDVRFEWRSIQEKGEVYIFRDRDDSSSSSSRRSRYSYPSDESSIRSGRNSHISFPSDESYPYSYSDDDYSDDYFAFESELEEEEVPPQELRKHYRAFRGGDHVDAKGVPLSTNDFDVEFNLKIKYNYKKSWCYAHLQFDNPAGVRGRNDCIVPAGYPVFNENGSKVVDFLSRDSRWALKGSGDGFSVNLKRCFMGYNILADGKHRLDIEVGRRKLDDVFDSEIQFTSRFDGILLKYASAIDEFSDWYIDGGAFVIDERTNHFGWVAEVGLIDIMDTGLDLRYNIIDWQKFGTSWCCVHNPLGTRFLNSEVTVTYTIHPKFNWFGCREERELPIEFYGGFLINHAAKKHFLTHHKKKNLGWYAGIYIGNVDKEGDWSFDLEYIVVQAQAVAENDVGSIGRGNILNLSLLDVIDESIPERYSDYSSCNISSDPIHEVKGLYPLCGNTNFIGYRAEFLYALTDNLSLDTVYEFSYAEDERIGGRHHYHDFELEAIYAF